jgi:hypothetical protein
MDISQDIKLIQKIKKDLMSIRKTIDLNPDNLSVFCQEMKNQYIKLAEELGNKYEKLSIKLRQKML